MHAIGMGRRARRGMCEQRSLHTHSDRLGDCLASRTHKLGMDVMVTQAYGCVSKSQMLAWAATFVRACACVLAVVVPKWSRAYHFLSIL